MACKTCATHLLLTAGLGPLATCLVPAVGAVPLEWYKDEDHIGYDKGGQKIIKSARKDKLDQLLDRNDSKKVGAWACTFF